MKEEFLMARAMDVSDYIISFASDKGKPVSNLKLQKIMYFLNVIHLIDFNMKPLIDDESFERWDYGPVIRSVYREYSSNGATKIKEPSEHVEVNVNDDGSIKINKHKFNDNNIDKKAKEFINENIDKLIDFDPFYLVDKSHEEQQWKELCTNSKYDNISSAMYYKNNCFWS
jgi:uncharacterized phage-associated protein